METYAYNYHPATGEYLGASLADESPREPGVFILPGHATWTPPPPPEGGFIIRFVDGAWGFSPVVEPGSDPTPEPVVSATMVNVERSYSKGQGYTTQISAKLYDGKSGGKSGSGSADGDDADIADRDSTTAKNAPAGTPATPNQWNQQRRYGRTDDN